MTHVPSTDVTLGESPGKTYFEDLEVGDRSPMLEISDIKVSDFVRYAGASGDFNPLHYDHDFTTSQGYDDVFAMGMLNTAFLSNVVVEWLGLSTVTHYRTQFDAIAWPGDDLTGYAEVASVDDDDASVTCDLVMENGEGERVISGTVSADLPTRDK
ncbi:MaoC family dehydratase [Natrinema halophilum]|uniref:MaoC family dehydratase n=1 Tax=Natrinema halophilum TaxID=1699371 RepID=UPI001F2E301A|nr:MaoC/PaaZ C-terminal domain-containing protein [Natrinema halophilum]UHQ96376.1 hypothetical protein HYG82_22265 [Natrinema halophilum]